jgi:O-methyltransferase
MALSAKPATGTVASGDTKALAAGRLLLRGPRRAYRLMKGQYDAWRELSYLGPTLERIRPLSMVPNHALIQLARQVRQTLAENVAGDFVECGVWRGGSAFLVADLLRRQGAAGRKVWLFDSFEGHRVPEEIDGPAAVEYVTNTDSPEYYDNCRVAIEDVQRSAQELGLSSYTEIVKGWFEESLSATRERIGSIALLRIDCDWHASVRTCLDQLYDQVSDGGFVIFDDYYAYDGCTIAVHEFLAERKLPHRIACDGGIAYFRKS